jgi:hypothetical protein
MSNANQQAPFALFGSKRILIAGGAGLLILVGLVFQLGALAYSHVQPGKMWIASTVARNVCNICIMQLDRLAIHAVETYWPLLFVSLGPAILLLSRREAVLSVISRSRGGQDHAQ